MASTGRSVRGAGTDRAGATDTTMLIWQTIDANPGITRDELFAKIEWQIDAGYARRRYFAKRKINAGADARTPALILQAARRLVLLDTLAGMIRFGTLARDGDGRLRTLRPIKNYKGDPERVDPGGAKAAEHLNRAYAEKRLREHAKRTAGRERIVLTGKIAEAYRLIYGARQGDSS